MRLILEVISANGDMLGSNRSKTIGPEGAQIGRSKESDWVINDPYISRVHARIRCSNGHFYVEGTGRNPLALNDPSNVVPNHQPQQLHTGDRFFLDQYEIRVSVEAHERRAAEPGVQESDNPTVRVLPLSPAWQPDIRVPEAQSEPADGALDPLQILHAARAPIASPPARASDAEPIADRPVAPAAPRVLTANEPTPLPINVSAPKIPETYRAAPIEPTTRKVPPGPSAGTVQQSSVSRTADMDSTERWSTSAAADSSGDAAVPHTASIAPELPEPRGTPFERREPWVSPPERPDLRPKIPERHEPRVSPPERPDGRGNLLERQPFERPAPPVGFNKTINRAAQASAPPPVPHEPLPPPLREARSISLEQLLAAAGVPESQLSADLAEELGEVLRVVVQGLMEVLQSRAEIKSQLRMNVTLMKPAENNPLKFSPNVEAALHTLLVERNRGYLPTVRAFQEALSDVRHHQIAVLQGMRSAFHAMLEQFNPVRLEQEFERHGAKRGLLNVGAKSRFRDCYVEEFERLTRDPDASFKRLFGEYFAQAYEDQMEQLKSAARNDAR